MKNLYESLLDDFEKLEDSIDLIKEIKQFLKDNYSDSDKLKISKEPNEDGLYEVDCRNCEYVDVGNYKITSLTNGMFEFINVKNFYCTNCKNLTSLEGAPKEVENFNCCGGGNLTSLKGAPEKVVGGFNCSWCKNLTSLEGAPKEVKGTFNCSGCIKLTSLKGAPKKVREHFACSRCATAFTSRDVKDVCNVKGYIYT